jgi:hypothetical protein
MRKRIIADQVVVGVKEWPNVGFFGFGGFWLEGFWFEGFWFEGFWFEGFWLEGFWLEVMVEIGGGHSDAGIGGATLHPKSLFMKRPFAFYPLVLLLVVLGISAAFGGGVLLFNPELMGAPADLLAGTPFSGFFLPGLILLVFNGLFPLFVAFGLWRRPAWDWANVLNIYPDRHWAWTYALYAGFSVIIWITVQITMVEFTWLQPAYIAVGLLILICTLTPATMRYYHIPPQSPQLS